MRLNVGKPELEQQDFMDLFGQLSSGTIDALYRHKDAEIQRLAAKAREDADPNKAAIEAAKRIEEANSGQYI